MPDIKFSGLASGIDGEAIIQATIEARRLAAIPLENKVTQNESESTALEEFNTRLLSIRDSVKEFLTLAGGAVSRTASSSNEDSVVGIASSNAPTLSAMARKRS